MSAPMTSRWRRRQWGSGIWTSGAWNTSSRAMPRLGKSNGTRWLVWALLLRKCPGSAAGGPRTVTTRSYVNARGQQMAKRKGATMAGLKVKDESEKRFAWSHEEWVVDLDLKTSDEFEEWLNAETKYYIRANA